MKHRKCITLNLLLLIILINGCRLKEKDLLKASFAAKKHISFQPELHCQTSLHDGITTLENALQKKHAVITFFNTDCSKCVSQLQNWDKFIRKNHPKTWDIDFIFIGYGISSHFLDFVIDEKIPFNYPIYFIHTKSELLKENGMLEPYLDQSIILRDKTEVLYVGKFMEDFSAQGLFSD